MLKVGTQGDGSPVLIVGDTLKRVAKSLAVARFEVDVHFEHQPPTVVYTNWATRKTTPGAERPVYFSWTTLMYENRLIRDTSEQ